MGGRGARGLRARVSGSAGLAEGGRLNTRGIQAGGVCQGSHSIISRRNRDAAWGQFQE